ncbi:MAG: hypothetical protein ACRD0S_02210 [Acidimicrobiales bacterium]
MITGWLVKIVLAFVIVGLLLVEGGSPLITKAQLDDIAHDAADNAALDLLDKNDIERARKVAEDIVLEKDAALTAFSVEPGRIRITVEKEARSFLLKNVDQFRDWYDVEVTVSASTVRR